jgi:hypothetical protein
MGDVALRLVRGGGRELLVKLPHLPLLRIDYFKWPSDPHGDEKLGESGTRVAFGKNS